MSMERYRYAIDNDRALLHKFSGKQVTEFLLVPWVGACIHTPPPPPNQIVHVKSAKPFEIKGMFDAVWVTGRMAANATRQSVHIVDGSSEMDIRLLHARGPGGALQELERLDLRFRRLDFGFARLGKVARRNTVREKPDRDRQRDPFEKRECFNVLRTLRPLRRTNR